MVKYVDYDYYEGVYEGTMPMDSFNKIVITCSAHLKRITFGRVNANDVPEEVKYACCAMCDEIYEDEKSRVCGRVVKSESNDGYSVTFVTDNDEDSQAETMRNKLYRIAELYLGGAELLSMRCDYDNEY